MDYGSPPPQDPLAALKATMARIVNRGAAEAGEGPPQAMPTLLPPGAGMGDSSPAQVPLVAPLSSGQTSPTETPPASHPTPPSNPRSYPTPRGNIDQTIELGPSSAATVHNQPDDKGTDAATDADRTNYGATIDLPPPKQKQPSTYDDRRIAQTMAAAGMAADDTERVAKLWRGTFDPSTSPRTSLKGDQGAAKARDSKLVIKHRALRDVRETTRVGADYELLTVIGEGGMGVVYSARQASIDRTVAVKMLKNDIASDVDQREKFLSEAVVTGDLDHPNIVPIYDLGSNETGALFYSMKRVQGTPWMSVIEQKSLAENLEILMKVADAVAFAHSRGVIHRDIKPENVMLGDFGEVLVMDWGLAMSTAAFRKADSITQTSSMGGTPAYMAPEMATGPIDRIGPASDIYLLGAILYEIITGKPPHTGKNVMNCLFAAAQNEIQPTEHSGELMDIALKAMSTVPGDRYASVQDFQAAIRQYQSHSESIVLSTRAEQDLEAAEERAIIKPIPARCSRSRKRPRCGTATSRPAVASRRRSWPTLAKPCARKTSISALRWSIPAIRRTSRCIAKSSPRQRERDSRQQRLKSIRRTAVAMGVAILVGGTFAAIKINSEKNLALGAEASAKTAEKQAKADRDLAVAAENRAKDAKTKADEAAQAARDSADAATKAKDQAHASELAAKEDRDKANDAKKAKKTKPTWLASAWPRRRSMKTPSTPPSSCSTIARPDCAIGNGAGCDSFRRKASKTLPAKPPSMRSLSPTTANGLSPAVGTARPACGILPPAKRC